MAEAHSAHAQIFDLCEYLADKDRLCQHMSAGGFHAPCTLSTSLSGFIRGSVVIASRQCFVTEALYLLAYKLSSS